MTRLRDAIKESKPLFELFDTAVLYEGESAFLQLVDALGRGETDLSALPNLIHKDASGAIQQNKEVFAENMDQLPPPDFDGLPLEKYSCRN